jgi:gentisate 1,2-dioxygenase
MTSYVAGAPLWNYYIGLHRAELERKSRAECVVDRGKLEPEQTPFGLLRWYLHPLLEGPASHAMYFAELEIPAGSCSGKLRHQGSLVNLVVEGEGYTLAGGVRYDWVTEDVVAIPAKPDGVEVQHFAAEGTTARIVMAWPNFDSGLGAGLGIDLAVLEPAPGYAEPDTDGS